MHQLIQLVWFYTGIVTRVDRNFNLINSRLYSISSGISGFTFEFYIYFFLIFLRRVFTLIYFRSSSITFPGIYRKITHPSLEREILKVRGSVAIETVCFMHLHIHRAIYMPTLVTKSLKIPLVRNRRVES